MKAARLCRSCHKPTNDLRGKCPTCQKVQAALAREEQRQIDRALFRGLRKLGV